MSSKNVSRRRFLTLSGTALAGVMAAACQPKVVEVEKIVKETVIGEGESKVVEKVVKETVEVEKVVKETVEVQVPAEGGMNSLRLSAWADVSDAVVYANISNAFMEMYPDMTVSVEQYPGGYYQKVLANFAAGDPADVIYFQGWRMPAYADNMAVQPLDPFIDANNAQAFFPDTANYNAATKWQGKTYVTPTDCGALVTMYNKDMFDEKGIAYPESGWTYEDMQAIIEELTYEKDGMQYYGWAQAGGWNGTYSRFLHWLRKDGEMEWDTQVEPTKALWDKAAIWEPIQYLVNDTIDKGFCPSPDIIAGGGVGLDTGRVAMVMEGPWYMPRLWGELASQQPGINWDCVTPAVGSDGKNHTTNYIHGHTMAAATNNPEAAWDLIAFIISEEGETIIANGGRMCGTPSGINNIWGPIAAENYNFTNFKAFADGMAESDSVPVQVGEGMLLEGAGAPITALWDACVGVQMTAQEACEMYNPDIQAALDLYWADRS